MKKFPLAILAVLGIVSMVANVVTAMTFIYPIITRHFYLDLITGLDHGTLLANYRIVVQYILLPWVTDLYTPDFIMSASGAFHFWEVKVIYHIMQAIAALFLATVFIRLKKRKPILPLLNLTSNFIFILFGSLLAGMLIDFDFFFYWFHRLFFNNDYWLFHPRYDPIILAMPYQLFMIFGIMIVVVLFVVAGVIKGVYYQKKKTQKTNAT